MIKKINIKKLGLFFVIFGFVSSIILSREVNDLDEIWNFNFARCISNGLVPYRDFNIILGPFVSMVTSVFLTIFGQEMLVTRFLAIILDTTILFMVYSIMSDLKIKEYLKYMVLILLALIMRPYFTIDYNWTMLLFLLIILKLEIKENNILDVNFKYNLLLGILAGICITIKQTTGLVIATVIIGYKILQIRKKQDILNYIKIFATRLLGATIPIMLMFIYLILNNALTDYIDYCILGIATFSNKISYVERLIKNKNILIKILSLLPSINIVTLGIYLKNKDKNMLLLFLYSIVNMLVVYPISDESHFVIAIVPTIINCIYIINLLVNKIKVSTKEEIFVNSFLRCAICIFTLISIGYFIINMQDKNLNLELAHFKYLPMSEQDINSVKEICTYIQTQDKKIYILDATAALYMIPIERYNKNYDMFNKGNLGSKGEQGQIENLQKDEDKRVLIRNKSYKRNWQNPEEVREYVKNNMTKIGEIGIFDIYD